MNRRSFVFGLFSGLLIGIGVASASFAMMSRPTRPSSPKYQIIQAPQGTPAGIPDGAQRHEINGQIYYIVPLLANRDRNS